MSTIFRLNPVILNFSNLYHNRPARWRRRTERGFWGNKAAPGAKRLAAAPKISRSEGSLRSKPATAVAFLCLLSLAKQRK